MVDIPPHNSKLAGRTGHLQKYLKVRATLPDLKLSEFMKMRKGG